jgi:hypothetical protein
MAAMVLSVGAQPAVIAEVALQRVSVYHEPQDEAYPPHGLAQIRASGERRVKKGGRDRTDSSFAWAGKGSHGRLSG